MTYLRLFIYITIMITLSGCAPMQVHDANSFLASYQEHIKNQVNSINIELNVSDEYYASETYALDECKKDLHYTEDEIFNNGYAKLFEYKRLQDNQKLQYFLKKADVNISQIITQKIDDIKKYDYFIQQKYDLKTPSHTLKINISQPYLVSNLYGYKKRYALGCYIQFSLIENQTNFEVWNSSSRFYLYQDYTDNVCELLNNSEKLKISLQKNIEFKVNALLDDFHGTQPNIVYKQNAMALNFSGETQYTLDVRKEYINNLELRNSINRLTHYNHDIEFTNVENDLMEVNDNSCKNLQNKKIFTMFNINPDVTYFDAVSLLDEKSQRLKIDIGLKQFIDKYLVEHCQAIIVNEVNQSDISIVGDVKSFNKKITKVQKEGDDISSINIYENKEAKYNLNYQSIAQINTNIVNDGKRDDSQFTNLLEYVGIKKLKFFKMNGNYENILFKIDENKILLYKGYLGHYMRANDDGSQELKRDHFIALIESSDKTKIINLNINEQQLLTDKEHRTLNLISDEGLLKIQMYKYLKHILNGLK